LDDKQLRTLVARLSIAELSGAGRSVSGVTAGGHQNAGDGGLDVRVEVSGDSYAGDFIRRVPSGFQVKNTDMGPAAITKEMKPKGLLREVIADLADAGGSYVIVSSQGTVADVRLKERRKRMAEAVEGHPSGGKLHLDFYDRTRLATWVNKYPGVATWVRTQIGRPLAGWQALGNWSGSRVGGDGKYIADDATCLVDARSKEEPSLPVLQGIDRLREALSEVRQCVRLIGMSGLGKTRLVQALFENDVGAEALDPALALYTDYAETPQPTAKQLALQLVETGQRAILVVDNCNPQTHSDLANICSSSGSRLSLITVEYDVRDDEPERTEVFRLQAASESTIAKWLETNFDYVSRVDRDRIAEFSGGNFRVAGVLAETIKRGDSLGDLRDRDLFQRIFQQRNDHSGDLLKAAEAVALVYSFDGEDTSASSELAILAPLAGTDANKLYEFVVELKRRSVVQSRGRWRALLPHAIANRLAAQALERIPTTQLDAFCAGLPSRMRRSFSRRLGYLHDSEEARRAVARYLAVDGHMGDLLAVDDDAAHVLRNLAPVAPASVLERIETEVAGPNGDVLTDPRTPHRWQLTSLLKSLAYDPALFDRAAAMLAKFVAAERPDENQNSAQGALKELFHLHLSGTKATPEQRRNLIRSFYGMGTDGGRRCGRLALQAILESTHFTSTSNFDFGARPRDFGWHPPTYGDIWNWYKAAVDLAVELSANGTARAEIKRIVSGRLRGIIGIEACLDSIEAAAGDFLKDGEWIDGWLAIRAALRFDHAEWRPDVRKRVLALEAKLRPSGSLNEARAYVLEGRGFGFDLLDGDEEEEKDYSAALSRLSAKAESLGRELAEQPALLNGFLEEVIQASQAPRAFSFGVGLGKSTVPAEEMWETLKSTLQRTPSDQRNPTVLGGFLHQIKKDRPELASAILDNAVADPEMASSFVYLQGQAGIDDEAIDRLKKAISLGYVEAWRYGVLATGVIRSAPQALLADMLDELSALSGGVSAALDILHMAIYCAKSDGFEVDGALSDLGHSLLLRMDYRDGNDVSEHRVQQTIKDCYKGPAGEGAARELCRHLKQKIAAREVYAFQLDHVFDALFEVQPAVALDELMLTELEDGDPLYGSVNFRRSPLQKVAPAILWAWADVAPADRYPLIGRSLEIFATKDFDQDDGLLPLFVEALERSPDRAAYLAGNSGRLHPSGWSGSLVPILKRRASWIEPLTTHSDEAVRSWAKNQIDELDRLADVHRARDSEREETFE
jgi:hypothetical protein